MIEGKPSRTAFMTAVQRGHHHAVAPEPKILRDDLALALAGVDGVDGAQVYIDMEPSVCAVGLSKKN